MVWTMPIFLQGIVEEDTQEALFGIMSAVAPEKGKPFQNLSQREIGNANKAFVTKIMCA